jgi:MFS family permease
MTDAGLLPSRARRDRRTRAAFPVLALVVVAVNLPQSVVVPVLPRIQESYGTDQVTSTWLLTGFLLSSGVATPLLGRLGDGIGQRRILALALGVLALGCAGAALAPTVGWAIAMRFVQGISGGAVPVAFSAVRAAVPPARLTYGVAVLATVGSIAFSLGIVAAGPLLSVAGRPAVFLLPCVVALVAAAGVLLVLPPAAEPRPPVGRFGTLPVLLFSGALVCLLLAISQSSSRGWASPLVVGLAALGLLLGGWWAARERGAAVPFIDLAMMRRRGVWAGNLVAVLAGIGLFGCAAGMPSLLQAPRGDGGVGASLDEVGLLMAPIALAAFLTSLCTGRLYRSFPARGLLVVGAALSSLSYAGVALWHGDAWGMVGWCALQGVGNGLILSTVASVVVAAVPAHQTGVASGLNTNIRTIGGSFGAATTAAILSAHTVAGRSAESGFVVAFAMMAVAMAVAGAAALLVPEPDLGRAGR